MGPNYILVNISADFKENITSNDVESTIARLDSLIKKQLPDVKRVFIEAESRQHFVTHKANMEKI